MFNEEMNRLRGLGILLVIVGHSIFIDILTADALKNVGYYVWIFDFIYSFHMPLFFLMSGFFSVKALEIKGLSNYIGFIKDKFKKLMVPYFTLTIIATVIKLVLSCYANRQVELGSLVKITLLYPWNNPLKLLWYIYTLFFIFAITPLIRKIPLNLKLGIFFSLNLLPFNYGSELNLNGILRYTFFFYLGIFFRLHYKEFLQFKKKTLITVFGILLLALMNLFNAKFNSEAYDIFKALVGIAGFTSLVYIMKNKYISSILDLLGIYSYEIYLLHWFTQMPIRMLYQKFHFNYNYLVMISFCTAFLVIPISKYILNRSKILSGFLLGNFKNVIKPNINYVSIQTKIDS